MMNTKNENIKTSEELAGEDLFNFATEREDIKTLVAHLPQEAECTPQAVEYELQLLKIISTGWSITFFLENQPAGEQISEIYWQSIHDFSGTLSETSRMMTGTEIDYFQVLRERLDMYVKALAENSDKSEPAAVVGPEFAKACGSSDDIYAVMAGSRMFLLTVSSVRKYLEALQIC
jgi:hypothetical protein